MNAAVTGAGDMRDARRLADLESVIERGLGTFVEVGEALLEIRGSRLYRYQHRTFEDYCRVRWNLARNRAYQLMEAAEVSKVLDTPPAIESHARELAPVLREEGPEAVREVWSQVNETIERPTADAIREYVQGRGPRTVSAVVIDAEPSIRVTLQAFERDIRRLRDGYQRYRSDERFITRYGAVLAAIDAALEGERRGTD